MTLLGNTIRALCRLAWVWLLVMPLVSCNHKELEYGGSANVTVQFDWTKAPQASPASMAMMVYSLSSLPVLISFQGRNGGSFIVPTGSYQFIGYNDDSHELFTRGDNYDSFQIYSQHISLSSFSPMFAQTRDVPRAPNTEGQTVIAEPDPLWTSATPEATLVSDIENLLTMTMQDAIKTYHFTITNVENLQYATELAGTISGMSEAWVPSAGHGSDLECIIPFSLESDGTSTLSGSIRTFGHCPHNTGKEGDAHNDHKLVIYVKMNDGNKYYYTFDVTNSIHATDPGGTSSSTTDPDMPPVTDVDIFLDDVPLPKPLNNGAGIHPEVTEWQEIEVDINMK